MSVDPVDWKNCDPVTGIGDPSTPVMSFTASGSRVAYYSPTEPDGTVVTVP